MDGGKSIFDSSSQTAMLYKTSTNVSCDICDAVLLQETIIASHPSKQIQTPDDLKRKNPRSFVHCAVLLA